MLWKKTQSLALHGFLSGESPTSAWEAFTFIFVATYAGYPDILDIDQGPQFAGLK